MQIAYLAFYVNSFYGIVFDLLETGRRPASATSVICQGKTYFSVFSTIVNLVHLHP